MRTRALFSFALLLTISNVVFAQDVVSASSGVLHYFEGSVAIDGKPAEHKAATFLSLKNGSTIRTEKGRAELLLTPGVYLRLDENSSLAMISNSLTDTRLQLLTGTAIVDSLSAGPAPNDSVVLVYDGSDVRFTKPGVFRIDCEIGELQAYNGESTVTHHRVTTAIDSLHRYYFALEMTTDKAGEGDTDEFYDWAHNRSDMIEDQNQVASADRADAQDADANAGIFVIPPAYSSPSYATPSMGSSTYYGSAAPFYVYSPMPVFSYASYVNFVVFGPMRYRPVGTKWPVSSGTGTGIGYRPSPVGTRWPVIPVRGVVNHPAPVPAARYQPVAPRVAVPHVVGIGHR